MGIFQKDSIVLNLAFHKNPTGSFMENKYSQGEDSRHRKCMVLHVRGYDGFTKNNLIRDCEERDDL